MGEGLWKRCKMPIYEYHCPRCGEDFEKLVFGSAQVECPKCKCAKPDKKMSTFGMAGTSEKGGSLASSAAALAATRPATNRSSRARLSH